MTAPQNASSKIPLQATLEKADPRLRTALILAGVLSGLLLSAMDQTVVATALPTIVED
ncbi:MAG: EmrB/QacA family drug resistance transporter, partial [Acidobacteria bacterium]|nr:EmrB/QacA family drug resistance transporter [Acidobacteriota bacterium]